MSSSTVVTDSRAKDKMATQLYVKPPPDAGKKKKWSFGNLFKRREPRRSVSSSSDSLSSDQDRVGRKKGGFLSRRKKRHNRGSKDVTDSFTVIAPPNNPSLVPPGTQRAGSAPSVPPPPPLVGTPESGRSGSLTSLEGRRRIKAKVEASRELLGAASSSGEEDERPHLAHTCGSWPHSKRTRAARTERYIRRLSKDSIEGPETTAWKKWRPTTHSASTSPAHSPAPGRGNSKYSFRSASYDGNLLSGVRQSPTPPPPPPPPRRYDPPRPMSYAFEAEAPDPTRNTGGSLGRSRAYRTASERLIPSSGPRPQHPFHNQNRPLRHLHGPTNSSIDRNRPPQQHPIPAPRTSLKLPITHHSRSQDNSASRGDVLVRPYNYNVPVSPVTSEKPAGEPRLPLVKLDNNVRNAENLINNNYYYHPSRTAVTASPKDGNGTRRQYICEPKLTNGFLMGEQCHQQNERIKPPQDATEFWRQQELRAVRSSTLSSNGRTTERNCSDSPRPKDLLQRAYHLRSDSGGSTQSEASSAVSSLTRMKEDDVRPLSIVVEKSEQSDMENNTKLKPPAPPERKSSRQSSVSSNADFEKRSSGNLEDALNELEEIYRTLKLGEEDVAPEDIQRPGFRGTESDTGFNYDPDRNKSARMTDDMAYRRLNKKEVNCLQDSRELVSRAGSYLLVSPTLSPPSLFSFCQDPGNEPDITKDDVVYRNINHTNNTLKISDPQPPFGIPLGPVTPAPESDYLHATPSATPLPEASPDIVTDDLAFRNLRKDSTQESTLSLKKKKAVRSLSANLSSYIKREYDTSSFNTSSSTLSGHEVNNNNLSSTESLKPTAIPAKTVTRLGGAEGLRLAHRMLDNRRRALFKNDSEEKNTSPRVIECRVTAERINTPTKEELRRKFFSDAYRDLEKSKESNVLRQMEEKTEAELLRQLEDEARATSRQIGLLQRQQSSGQHRDDTKSVAQLLKELTKSLDQDFGKACKACQMSRVDDGAESVAQCSDDEIVPPVDSADSEDCVEQCDQPTMVAPTHNMNDGRDERVARYKEERRRQLAAQFGSRSAAPLPEPRSTRASRLRSQALVESARTHTRPTQQNHSPTESTKNEDENHCNGDTVTKKEKDKSHKRKSNLNRSINAEPISPTSAYGERRRQNGSLTGGSLSSGVPRSAQLVKRQVIANSSTSPYTKRSDRGSTPDSDGSSSTPGGTSRIPRKITSPQVTSPLSSPNHRTQHNSIPQRVFAKSNNSSDSSPLRLSSLPSSPARHPPHSILKKSSLDETGTLQQPVSILKRKTSQEDGCGRSGSPVRFSPTVVERKGRGILKKHRSLDDSRRSPDSLHHSQNGVEECRPILKGQPRRCSLEEVVKRSAGVEPQGILKRKTSRDEVMGDPTVLAEQPQGILKRKASPNHISVAESVIRSAAESLHDLDHVKPILKKKEEQLQEAVFAVDAIPRPILKKKSSSEEEEHPVKPILKPPKKEDEVFSDSSCSSSGAAGGGTESPIKRQYIGEPRPILKYSAENDVLAATCPSPPNSPLVNATRNKPPQSPAHLENLTRRQPIHGGGIDEALSAASPPPVPLAAVIRTRTSPPPPNNDNVIRKQPILGHSGDELASPSLAPLGNRTSMSPTHLDNVSRRQETLFGSNIPSLPNGQLAAALRNRTSPPPSQLDNLNRRHSLLTAHSPDEAISPSSSPSFGGVLRNRATPSPTLQDNSSRRETAVCGQEAVNESLGQVLKHRASLPGPPSTSPTQLVLRNKAHVASSGDNKEKRRTLDPSMMSRRSKSPLALDMARPRPLSVAERIYNLEAFLAFEGELVGSIPKRSSSSAGSTIHTRMEGRSNEEVAGLRRSGSVSEKASMWTKLEHERLTEAAAQRKLNKGNRFRNKVDTGRFNTQPVTQGEVEQAKRNNTLDCVDEEDPSRLSVVERVKLFSRSGGVIGGTSSGTGSSSENPPSRGATSPLTAVQRAQSSSIVSGLMKNLVQKTTGSAPKLGAGPSHPDSEIVGENRTGDETEDPSPAERRRTSSATTNGSSIDDEDESSEDEDGSSLSPDENLADGRLVGGQRLSVTVHDEEEFTSTTEGESSSSGGREIRSIMTNGTSISKRMLRCGEVTAIRRCATQPMPPASHHHHHHHHMGYGGHHHVMQDEPDDAQPPPTTIAQRLAALQKSGQSDWRKRVTKSSTETNVPMVTNNANNVNKNSALAERVGKLESAAQGWKSRVVTADSHQFTVAGRMAVTTTPPLPPAVGSLGQASRTPVPQIFNSASVACIPTRPPAVAVSSTAVPPPFNRSTSVPDNDRSNEVTVEGPKVTIPKICDEEFDSFFSTPRIVPFQSTMATSEFSDIDFEQISVQHSQLLVHKKNVRVQRKHRSVNPVKALAQRSDLRTEYVEVRSTSVTSASAATTRELKTRLNYDKSHRNVGLAAEALAGLASKEDLKSVMLRRTADSPRPWAVSQWQHPLLLRVKGRRHTITTVVRPHYSTINQGDTFILVTQNQVFHWIGEYCNVIEKCRGSEIAQEIQSRKDLGCVNSSNVVTLVGNGYSDRHAQFWQLLSLPEDKIMSYTGKPAGHPDEDEVYEAAIAETYTVYELSETQLVPVQSYWGRMPKIDVFESNKVLVFDFGSEVFVWGGKNTDLPKKKFGTQLAKELAKGRRAVWHPTGIDWLDKEMDGETRPDWSIVCKVTEHMEPVLFREKFLNWPSVDISASGHNIMDKQVDGVFDVYPCNADEMTKWTPPPPDFVLEGTHLGRGQSYFDPETRRHFEIITDSLKVWRVEDYRLVEVNGCSIGHFRETDSYKVKWDYRVNVTGRELSGKVSRHGKRLVGRERVATLLWQGAEAPVLERGAVAALAGGTTASSIVSSEDGGVEGGTTVVLRQGCEPPALRAALPGPLVTYRRKDSSSSVSLFLVLGDVQEEATLHQLPSPPSPNQLRSRASFWLVDTSIGHSYLWHGAHSQTHNRQVAVKAVNHLCDTRPVELGLGDGVSVVVEEIFEGSEPPNFMPGIEDKRSSYGSLLGKRWEYGDHGTMRMFQLSSILGEFKASPVVSVTYHPDYSTPYPYTQQELYSFSQPGLMLVDGGASGGVWLWQGWCDTTVFDHGGSVWLRHQAERRAAMTSALQYWAAVRPTTSAAGDSSDSSLANVSLVYAGLEPIEFTSLFPTWTTNSEAAEFNRKEGHSDGVMENIQDELSKLNKCNYPPSVLLQHPLPPGVDPTRLELYLDQIHFKELLGVSREEFKELSHWKRTKLKKAAGLF